MPGRFNPWTHACAIRGSLPVVDAAGDVGGKLGSLKSCSMSAQRTSCPVMRAIRGGQRFLAARCRGLGVWRG
jgi:hypothetical protein